MVTALCPDALRHLITDIFSRLGLSPDDAALMSDTLVQADMWGHSSHGVMRTSWYGSRLQSGVMRPSGKAEIITDTGPLLHLDGHDGVGQLITAHTAQMVISRARQFGICCASIRRSGHFGTAMYFTKQLAEAGMIGFLATNASPAMPPWGGVEKLVGNNPQSWAAPTASQAPFILDIAHTAVARGKIYLAREKAEPIPSDWALGPDGQPCTDPAQAILGSLLPMAGHKGFGMSAMMDILSGVLSGSAFGPDVVGPYVADKSSGAGHFMMAIDISKIRPVDDFTSDMAVMIKRWKDSQKAALSDGIFYPGEKEYLHAQQRETDGLSLPDNTLTSLLSYADSLDITTSLTALKK